MFRRHFKHNKQNHHCISPFPTFLEVEYPSTLSRNHIARSMMLPTFKIGNIAPFQMLPTLKVRRVPMTLLPFITFSNVDVAVVDD
jgi:hypothetical protein